MRVREPFLRLVGALRRMPERDELRGFAGRLRRTGRATFVELLSIVRELLRVPAQIFMRVAEVAGAIVLRAWLIAWPLLVNAWRLALRGLGWAQREVTPVRVTLAVAALVAVALGASQFTDYREVTIGTPQYRGVESVAPPPAVGAQSAGSAHSWLGLPLAAAALLIVAAAARGRFRLTRLLIPIGLLVVVMSVAFDAPAGLDEGQAAVTYEGANATLLGGFWVQLVSGIVLIALGPLLVRLLGAGAERGAARRRRRTGRLRRSRVPEGLRVEAGGAGR